ncbi:MAG: glutathione S-transferase family protein [Myxococcota bacterium]
MSDAVLTVYGVPASQPSRAVYWTCLIKGLAFELRTPELLGDGESGLGALNPKRQIPTIVQGDFVLYEMPAILAWLCNANGWDDFYPLEPSARALIDQYLHFHHTTTRLATIKLMASHVTIAFGGVPEGGKDILLGEGIRTAMSGPDVYERGRAVVQMVAELIEAGYLRDRGGYLCSRERPTIADIACYEELSQLRWASLFDFAGFPKLQSWLDRMAKLPFHENAHRYNVVLGDILSRPNTMERFIAAGTAGVAALEEIGIPINRDG